MRARKLSKISRLVALSAMAVALGASGCNKDGSSSRKDGPRLKWVKSPSSGQTEGDVIKIPGLQVSFTRPQVLYVYRDCAEASHSPRGEDGWIPVIECRATNQEDDEFSDSGIDEVITIYAAPKDNLIINERGVAMLKADYQQRGYQVESIIYIEDYQGKSGRRGIESKVQVMDAEGKYPEKEIQRLRFPEGDVVFIAEVEYPYGDDRSGIANDWQRILWNFQMDEDGPLFPDSGE